MRVKYLAQEHNTMTPARAKPRLLDSQSSTIRNYQATNSVLKEKICAYVLPEVGSCQNEFFQPSLNFF